MIYNSSSIAAFRPLGLGSYRIDWFGEVERQGLRGGRSPLVEIVLSPWQSGGDQKPKSRSVFVPVAFLGLCRIGDIWCAGNHLSFDPSIIREVFENLEVSDDLFDVKPAGLPLGDVGDQDLYPLPFSQFEAHRSHTGAQCVRLKVSADTTLVVPCMELVRFYFGASGSFLKRLFSGAFSMDLLYSSAKINPVTKRASLDLATDVPGVAAATIGRIAFDTHAQSAARWVVNSSVSASVNGERYYPKTTFPFRGETNLTAEGRWIVQANHRVFLAERLISCTHPFPFNELFYTSHLNVSAKGGSAKSKVAAANGSEVKDSTSAAVEHTVLEEGLVSPNLQPQSVRVDGVAPPFPDLLSKRIRRVKKNNSFGVTQKSGDQAVLAEGETRSSSNQRGAEVTSEQDEISVEEIPAEAFEVFEAAFKKFSEKNSTGARFTRPLPYGSSFSNVNLPKFIKSGLLVAESGEILPEIWCGRIEHPALSDSQNLIVFVRDHVNYESSTHVMVVLDVVNSMGEIDGVRDLCTKFAEENIEEIGLSNIRGMLDTTKACDMDEVLSFIERIMGFGEDALV